MVQNSINEQQARQSSELPSGTEEELQQLISETGRGQHQEAVASPVKMNVEHLNVYYGSRHAIKDVSIQIFEHQVTALMGPSGCGKSTFLRALDRMHDLTPGARVTGTVQLNDQDIYAPDVDVIQIRQQVGMVFQRPNPFPSSIFENVAYGLRIKRGLSRQEIAEIVERSLRGAALWDEVKDRLNKSAQGLSGGQQQRLCIARALAIEPEVLLMDEPASALDPISTLKIEELVDQLKSRYTIAIVTHNLQQAARVSQYTGFFLHGELIEFGETSTLFTRPKDKRTEDFVTGRFG
jgi:phosphate transport system ATP-binding protein